MIMSDSIYKPLIDSMRWSYSRVTSFDNCQYAWYLKYLYGEIEQPNFYASYGSFVHKLLERYLKGELPRQSLPVEFLTGFADQVDGRRPSDDVVGKYIESGYNYFRNFNGFDLECVAVEDRIEFCIGQNRFVGFIDFIGRDSDGGLVVVDHKSRNLKPRSTRKKPTKSDEELSQYLRQLYLYSVGIEQKYGELPTKLCFNCFRNGTFIEEPFNSDRCEEVMKWVTDMISYISKAERFRPNLDWFYCYNLCGFRESCCYFNDFMRG